LELPSVCHRSSGMAARPHACLTCMHVGSLSMVKEIANALAADESLVRAHGPRAKRSLQASGCPSSSPCLCQWKDATPDRSELFSALWFGSQAATTMLATGAKNRSRLKMGPGVCVESAPSAPAKLLHATCSEPAVEKEARSIQNDPCDQPRWIDRSQRSQAQHGKV
jgi:hypothetical protein